MNAGEPCEIGGGFLRRACGRPSVAACVYCGRAFCDQHGQRGADYADVCSRGECRTKQRDVEAHQQWRREAQPANRVSVCAQDGCEERMRYPCYRCRLLFCELHLAEHDVVDRRAQPPRRIRAFVCEHCHQRRRLWG